MVSQKNKKRTCLFIQAALILLYYGTSTAIASDSLCFDFNKKIVRQPLPIDGNLGEGDARSGELPSKAVWGAVRQVVQKPIAELLKKLLDPNTVKDPKTQKLEIESKKKSHLYAFHRVGVTINPFLFFTASWTEEWAYSVDEGSPEAPKSVVILYQKVEGTSHIEHLCGSILLRAVNTNATDIILYEEVKATRRSAQDTVNGHLGTLATLKK